MKKYKIDHIVWVVPNLEKGMELFEQLTGVKPVFGGYHKTLGTKNALVSLGNESYFEILAIDKNSAIAPPRWMGIDFITEPTITRWALKSENLESDCQILKNYKSELGTINEGQRTLTSGEVLKWKLTMPIPDPKVEVAPFLLDWSASAAHPTQNLPVHCKLLKIEFTHSQPESVNPVLQSFGYDNALKNGKQSTITIQLETPKGIVELS